MKVDVFISYATSDRRTANQLRDVLEKNGLTCWMDNRDILGGDDWAQAIVRALSQCRVLVAVVTPRFAPRPWTRFEVATVKAREGILAPTRVVPCIFEGGPAPMLAHIQHIDLRTDNQRAGFRALVKRIRALKAEQEKRAVIGLAGLGTAVTLGARWLSMREKRRQEREDDEWLLWEAHHRRLGTYLKDRGYRVPSTKAERVALVLDDTAPDAALLHELFVVDDLKEICRDLGLPTTGRKDDLIDRILSEDA